MELAERESPIRLNSGIYLIMGPIRIDISIDINVDIDMDIDIDVA